MASFSVGAATSSPPDNDSEPIIDLHRSKRATRNQNPVYTSPPLPEFQRLIDPIELEDDETGEQPAKRVKLYRREQDGSCNSAPISTDGSHAGGPDRQKELSKHILHHDIVSDDEMEYSSILEEESGSERICGKDSNQDENEGAVSDDGFQVPIIVDAYSSADGHRANPEPSPPTLETVVDQNQDDFNEARDTRPANLELNEPGPDAEGRGVDKAKALLEKIRSQKEAIDRTLKLIQLMTERSPP